MYKNNQLYEICSLYRPIFASYARVACISVSYDHRLLFCFGIKSDRKFLPVMPLSPVIGCRIRMLADVWALSTSTSYVS